MGILKREPNSWDVVNQRRDFLGQSSLELPKLQVISFFQIKIVKIQKVT